MFQSLTLPILDNNASEKAPEWSFAQSSLSPRELFPEHGRLTSSTQKFGSSFPHQASPRQQPLSSHNLPTDQSGAFGCLRAATPPLANDTPPSQTLPGDSRFKNPNHIPLQNSRITARDRQAKHSNQVKIYEPSFKKTVTELVAPIDKSELSDDDLLQKLRSLEHKFQAAIVEIESLKKIGKLNEDLIIELKEVKLVQEQKIRAAKLWHSELVQLRDENVRLRDSNTEVKEQNLRFRTDLIAYSHEINAMQIANCAEEDGTLRKRLIKYRKERDLARDKLKIFAMENGKDWREWMTKTDQVAAIGDEESFNMYEQLKKKRRK